MSEKVTIQTGEVCIIPLADYLIKILLGQRLADTMEHHVVVVRMEMVAGDDRAILKRGQMLLTRHPINHQLVLLNQLQEEVIGNEVCNSA